MRTILIGKTFFWNLHHARLWNTAVSVQQLSSPQTVEALYVDYHGWLVNWLRRKMDSASDAADLAQDTFVRILGRTQHGTETPGIREPHTYLATIAKGLLIDHWRRQALERAYLEALANQPEDSMPSPEARLMVLETLHALDALLEKLPTKPRQAFLMAQLDGMSHAEIAKSLGVSDRMVRKYLAQAMLQCLLADSAHLANPS